MTVLNNKARHKLIATPRQPGSEPFAEAAAKGIFKLPYCRSCNQPHWYPRPICPRCLSDKVEWESASGQGEIYTFTIMRRAKIPYAIGYVKLDEGPVMMSNLATEDFEALHIGMRVKVFFEDDGEGNLVPLFEPAE